MAGKKIAIDPTGPEALGIWALCLFAVRHAEVRAAWLTGHSTALRRLLD